jgi:hypothetical protein
MNVPNRWRSQRSRRWNPFYEIADALHEQPPRDLPRCPCSRLESTETNRESRKRTAGSAQIKRKSCKLRDVRSRACVPATRRRRQQCRARREAREAARSTGSSLLPFSLVGSWQAWRLTAWALSQSTGISLDQSHGLAVPHEVTKIRQRIVGLLSAPHVAPSISRAASSASTLSAQPEQHRCASIVSCDSMRLSVSVSTVKGWRLFPATIIGRGNFWRPTLSVSPCEVFAFLKHVIRSSPILALVTH